MIKDRTGLMTVLRREFKVVINIYSKLKNYDQLETGQANIVLMHISSYYLHLKVPSFFGKFFFFKLNQISAYQTLEFKNLYKYTKCTYDL